MWFGKKDKYERLKEEEKQKKPKKVKGYQQLGDWDEPVSLRDLCLQVHDGKSGKAAWALAKTLEKTVERQGFGKYGLVRVCNWDFWSCLSQRGVPIDFAPGVQQTQKQVIQLDTGADPKANSALERYLFELFHSDCQSLAMYLLQNAAGFRGYKVVVHVDYYRDRLANFGSLHKDTTGTTLFVVLHYLTVKAVLGPEYIYHPVAMKGLQTHGQWPHWLEDEVSSTRRELASLPQEIGYVTVKALGLVSFTDELIFHSTPNHERRWTEKLMYDPYDVVSIRGEDQPLVGVELPLKRRLSANYGDETLHELFQNAPKRRTFLRLWITVSPET